MTFKNLKITNTSNVIPHNNVRILYMPNRKFATFFKKKLIIETTIQIPKIAAERNISLGN